MKATKVSNKLWVHHTDSKFEIDGLCNVPSARRELMLSAVFFAFFGAIVAL
jgi:hypothetical protein